MSGLPEKVNGLSSNVMNDIGILGENETVMVKYVKIFHFTIQFPIFKPWHEEQ